MSNVEHDTCCAINIALRHDIIWPIENCHLQVQNNFKVLYGLFAVGGVIDDTHIHFTKT